MRHTSDRSVELGLSLARNDGLISLRRAGRPDSPTRWRAALLGTAAAGALFLGYGRNARADCYANGATLVCTGDVDGIANTGITVTAPYTTLEVENLTTGIAPILGNDGINFTSTGPVAIISDTTPFAINAVGDGAAGVYAVSSGGPVSVVHTGDIITTGKSIDYPGDNRADAITAFSFTGDVTVEHDGTIRTYGQSAMGIRANSTATNVFVTQAGTIVTNEKYGIGIWTRADYGSLVLNQTGSVTTKGDQSDALYGYTNSGSATIIQEGDITTHGRLSAGIFGRSFDSEVLIEQTGTIETHGDLASGIRALSSFGVVNVTQTGDVTTWGEEAHGISGRTGFHGAGEINITQNGSIATKGKYAAGIHGYSGYGKVSVVQTGDIETSGDYAHGIEATSYQRYPSDPAVNPTGDMIVKQTGSIVTRGYEARGILAYTNNTGNVSVTQKGSITIEGEDSDAIFAQVGYGSGNVTVWAKGDISASGIAVGSDSNSDGIDAAADFGDVLVTHTGNIIADDEVISALSRYGDVIVIQKGNLSVYGEFGYGILAAGASATVDQTGDILTTKIQSPGISTFADVGAVIVTQEGTIRTEGLGSRGIEALASNDASIHVEQTGTVTTLGEPDIGVGFKIPAHAIYASSEGTGDIEIVQKGMISTAGEEADGIFAQSQTGDISIDHTGDIMVAGRQAEGINGTSWAGGDVFILHRSGDITTTGDVQSEAIYAYSPGGGDVKVYAYGDFKTTGENGDGIFAESSGGDVKVVHAGVIDTELGDSDGIVAVVGTYGVAGSVSVVHNGSIHTRGETAEAIFARTFVDEVHVDGTGDLIAEAATAVRVSGGIGNSTVILRDGDVYGGGRFDAYDAEIVDGYGVRFVGGVTNTLKTEGSVSISGRNADILGGTGNETVNNYGWLTTPGTVDLGDGANAFNNMTGATFNSGVLVDLNGPGNTLANHGTLSPGGLGALQTTVLDGDLLLDVGSVFAVDVDMVGGITDKLFFDGPGAASVSGGLALNFFNITPTPAGPYTIIDTNSVLTGPNDLAVLNPVVLATITYPGGQDVALTIDGFNFSPDGLNPDQTAIGDNLNDIYDAGIGGVGPVLAGLASLTSQAEVEGALDQLSPEIYLDTEIAAYFASQAFSDTLLSCPVNASVGLEGQCIWVSAQWQSLDQNGTSESIGFDQTAGMFTAGGQFALGPAWRLGAGVGYQTGALDSDTGGSSDSHMVQGGISVKYNPGPLMIAGAVNGGRGWFDTTRPMAFDGFAATANGEMSVDTLAARLRASYAFEGETAYLKPILDTSITWVSLNGSTESGSSADLTVGDNAETVFAVSPALEVGGQWKLENGTMLRPYLRGGATWFSNDGFTTGASFADAPAGVGSFTVQAAMDQWLGDVRAGLDVVSQSDNALRLYYQGSFGAATQIHSANLKGSLKF